MANVFETALLCRQSAVARRVRPQLADPFFWSDVLISRPDFFPVITEYNLVTDTGDQLVDEFNNPFIASTA